MPKRIFLAIIYLFMAGCLYVCFSIYDYNQHPHGKWKTRGEFYSPSEHKWILYDEFEDDIWRETSTGNPYRPNYVPLTDELKKELAQEQAKWHKALEKQKADDKAERIKRELTEGNPLL